MKTTKRKIWKLSAIVALVFGFTTIFVGCSKDEADDNTPNNNQIIVNADTLKNRGFGLNILSDVEKEELVYGSPATTTDLPVSYDFSALMPPVRSQGGQGSCVGFSSGYALKSYQEKVQNGYSYTKSDGSVDNNRVMSPAYIFNQIGNTPCTGAQLKDAFELLLDQGVCTWSKMPYTDANCSTSPSANATSDATAHRIKSYQSVSVSDINQIKGFLYENKPVVFGASFDTAFWKGIFPKASNNEYICDVYNSAKKVGGHAMTVTGYDDNLNAFHVMNSWGKYWGNSGYIWIDYNTFKNMTHEAYIAEDAGGVAVGWRLYSLENYVYNNKLYYTAVWRKGNEAEIQLYNSTRQQFIDFYNEKHKSGYNVNTLNCYEINGQERLTSVFKKDNDEEFWAIGYAYKDYRALYDNLWKDGWRLHVLETYIINDQVLYTAVWRKYGGGEYQLYGATREQFKTYYNEKVSEGYRLHILNTYQIDGNVRHTAVFRPSTKQEQWLLDYKYEDYRKVYDDLWNQGYRLHHLSNYIIDGKLRYSAVFRPATDAEIQVYGWNYTNYRKYYDAIW